MLMWYIIMYVTLAVIALALGYLCKQTEKFSIVTNIAAKHKINKHLLSALFVISISALIALSINLINAFVCLLYLAMIWSLTDLLFYIIKKIRCQPFQKDYTGLFAIITSLLVLSYGWYLDHHVWQTTYNLTSKKSISPIKIVMFADSHTGTTFHAKGFARHMEEIAKLKPDVIIIAGDFVDDNTSPSDMVATIKTLGSIKTTYGIYFASGNHDKGYYGPAYRGFSEHELFTELTNHGIKVLQDDALLINNMFYIIGRKDYSVEKEQTGHRKSMQELTANLDKSKYMVVIDHQPTDYKNQALSKVDLVLSGHTHGGQLFPFNQVGKWIGANDRIYGHEKRGNTDFIVTSGLSDWAIKFKTGTKSEYVVINLN